MTTRTLSRALAVALALAGAPAIAGADDKDLTIDQVPAQAKATIQKQVADGTIEDIDQETRKGQTVFEVEFRDKQNQEFEIVVSEDGKLLDRRPE